MRRPLPAMPDATRLACAWRERGLAWLDGDGHDGEGRWSFVGRDPVERVSARFGEGAALARLAALGEHGEAADPLEAQAPRWIGFVAYDAAWADPRALGLRRGPRLARDAAVETLAFRRYDAVVAIDHVERRAWLVGDDVHALDALERDVERAREASPPRARAGSVRSEEAPLHLAAIRAALEAIGRGDVYQVNLARAWEAPLEGDALALALAMRDASPVPLGVVLLDEGRAVIARTMERYLRWDARTRELSTRPIKGTIGRSGDDRADAEALREDAKERAEHAMIVDLMRNDLGRVAETGSVRVSDVLRVEPYAKLHHLVSTVSCTTRAGLGARELVEATFPPGSVTGTPKLAAIELIEALERVPRGIYTGAIGHVDRGGGLALAVAIRTAVVEDGRARYFAGGGIVEASDPERELAETELKSRAFVDALGTLL